MNIFRVIARPLLAAPFVLGGLNAATQPEGHRAAAERALDAARCIGISVDAGKEDMIIRTSGAVQVAAGALLALGKCPRMSAAVLALTDAPAGLASFAVGDKSTRALHEAAARAGLIGGVMLAAFDRQGRPSLGYRISARKGGARLRGTRQIKRA